MHVTPVMMSAKLDFELVLVGFILLISSFWCSADPALFFGQGGAIVYTVGDSVINQPSNVSHSGKILFMYYCPHSSYLFYVVKEIDRHELFCSKVSKSLKLEDSKLLLTDKSKGIIGAVFLSNKSQIYWATSSSIQFCDISLGSLKVGEPKELLHVTTGSSIESLAYDFCKSSLFWIKLINGNSIIQKFDGSSASATEVLKTTRAKALSVDSRYSKLYWINGYRGTKLMIQSCDYFGQNLVTIVEIEHQSPNILLSHGSLFWTDLEQYRIWSYDLDHPSKPTSLVESLPEIPLGLSLITSGDCTTENYNASSLQLSTDLHYNLVTMPASGIKSSCDFLCLRGHCETSPSHGRERHCICEPGYSGDYCEVSNCHNYCLGGHCSLSGERPICSCFPGYQGSRCEVSPCFNYCLNGGSCLLSDLHTPVCKCSSEHLGERCHLSQSKESIVMVCAVTVFGVLLLVTWGVLLVRKRLSMKHSVARFTRTSEPALSPLNQCSLDIEDCCNMNICTTPCYEVANQKNGKHKKLSSSKKRSWTNLLLSGDPE